MPRLFIRSTVLVTFILLSPHSQGGVCEQFLSKVSNLLTRGGIQTAPSQLSHWPEEITETWGENNTFIAPYSTERDSAEALIGKTLTYWEIKPDGQKELIQGVKLLRISALHRDQIRLVDDLRANSKMANGKQREVGVWIGVTQDGHQWISELATSNQEASISPQATYQALRSLVQRSHIQANHFRSFHYVHTHPEFPGDGSTITGALLSNSDIVSQWEQTHIFSRELETTAVFHKYAVSINPDLDLISHYSWKRTKPDE